MLSSVLKKAELKKYILNKAFEMVDKYNKLLKQSIDKLRKIIILRYSPDQESIVKAKEKQRINDYLKARIELDKVCEDISVFKAENENICKRLWKNEPKFLENFFLNQKLSIQVIKSSIEYDIKLADFHSDNYLGSVDMLVDEELLNRINFEFDVKDSYHNFLKKIYNRENCNHNKGCKSENMEDEFCKNFSK